LVELEKERQIAPLPPVIIGGALVIPGGLLARLKGKREDEPALFAKETQRVEEVAMQTVLDIEKSLNYIPKDVSHEKCGYDVESAIPDSGKLRFIEVKGRIQGSKTVTVTKNEILTALNKPEDFILAVVLVPPLSADIKIDPWKIKEDLAKYVQKHNGCQVFYVKQPFQKEPDFGVTSVNYNLKDLFVNAEVPC
jgi:hypothetical protein